MLAIWTALALASTGVAGAESLPETTITSVLQAGEVRASRLADDSFALAMEGFDRRVVPGEPELPRKIVHVALPPDVDWSTLRLTLLAATTRVLSGSYRLPPAGPLSSYTPDSRPLLSWGEDGKDAERRRAAIYSANALHPPAVVRLLPHGELRKWQFARVEFMPVQYNPATGALQVTERAEIEIGFARTGVVPPSDVFEDTTLDHVARELVINYEGANGWYEPPPAARAAKARKDGPKAVYPYVIITTNAVVSGSTSLASFIAHKERWYNVLVVTEDDFDDLTGQAPDHRAEKIRQWLIDNYVGMRIVYVLLIGDPTPFDLGGNGIPMKLCWPRHSEDEYRESATDYFYADLTGNWDKNGDLSYGRFKADFNVDGGVDLYPEVFVGRIPVYGSSYFALNTILDRIVAYETEPLPDRAWRMRALLPMGFQKEDYDGAPLARQMRQDYLDAAGYTSWTMFQQGNGACGPDSDYSSNEELRGGSTVLNRWVNDRFGIVAWWGHGSSWDAAVGYDDCWDGPILDNGMALNLDANHPSFVFQNSCLNGSPDYAANLGYFVLRYGAVATVSASSISWFYTGQGSGEFDDRSGTNASIAYEYVKSISDGSWASAAGSSLYLSKSLMAIDSRDYLMNAYAFNLYGDPQVSLTSQPRLFVATMGSSDVTPYTARLIGHLSDLGTNSAADVSFDWGTTPAYGAATAVETKTAPGYFSATLTGLAGGTTYYFRAKAVADSTVYDYGMSFTTTTSAPYVRTEMPTDVTRTTARLQGTLSSRGSAPAVQASFEWGAQVPGERLAAYSMPQSPYVLAFDGTHIWSANGIANSVTKVRAADGVVIGTYAVGASPRALVCEGANLWTANHDADTVTKLRMSDGAVLGTYAVGDRPLALAYDGANVWVANVNESGYVVSGTLMKLRPADGQVLAAYTVGHGPLALLWDGSAIWAAYYYDDSVAKIAPADGQQLGMYRTASRPVSLAAEGNNLWVAGNDGLVTKLSRANGTVLGTFRASDEASRIVAAGAFLWVSNRAEDTVAVFQAADGARYGTHAVGDGPFGLAFDGSSVWVAHQSPRTLMKLRAFGYSNATMPQTLSAAGPFSAPLAGLTEGAVYHYRAKAVGHGTAFGADMTLIPRLVLRVPADYATIQAAIDAASNGNTVVVADGTYRGAGNKNLDLRGKRIIVRSENGAASCTIDSQGSGRAFYVHAGETRDTWISGFTLTGGSTDERHGAGILCDGGSPTIADCIITGNQGAVYDGGGIYCNGSSPEVVNCVVRNNSAEVGGGICCTPGAMPVFRDCIIENNTSVGYGGGTYCLSGSAPEFVRCMFRGNDADQGGGIFLSGASVRLEACTFVQNTARYGGGLRYYGDTAAPVAVNCIFASNEVLYGGGGLYAQNGTNARFTNCTFVWNTADQGGGGVAAYYAAPAFTNCIISGNSSGETGKSNLEVTGTPRPTVTYSAVSPAVQGEGNINSYPYVEGGAATGWRLHLACNSPCVDAGTNAAPDLPATDFEDDVRIFAATGEPARVDMGADESMRLQPMLANGSVAPAQGVPTTLFRFTVEYAHTGDVAPVVKTVVINDVAVTMQHLSGTAAQGTYYVDRSLPPNARFYFSFQDATGCTARFPEMGTLTGPTVVNQCPVLREGSVSPPSGDTTTVFHFSVAYEDPDGTAPARAVVLINDEGKPMQLAAGTAANGTYVLDTTLAPDSQYCFVFDDGFGCFARLPAEGMLPCPAVARDTRYVPDDFPSIKAALAGCADGDIIAVRDGVYRGADNKNVTLLGKHVILRSAQGPAHCIIDCEGDGAAFVLGFQEKASAQIDGFTVINGNAAVGGALYCAAALTIKNCRFIGNQAAYGGAVAVGEYASPAFLNCMICGNAATAASGWGGGVYVEDADTVLFINCTIADNSAYLGGGIAIANAMQCTVTNTILWGNTATVTPQLRASPFILTTVDYCDVQGGQSGTFGVRSWGTHTIDADPLFADPDGADGAARTADDDYRLGAASPCIDAGDGAATALPSEDFEGTPRVADGNGDGTSQVDIGADELYVPAFRRGDANADGRADLSDAITVLRILFAGAVTRCARAANADGDDRLDIADAVFLLQYLFAHGPTPPFPFAQCGAHVDALSCVEFPPCQ